MSGINDLPFISNSLLLGGMAWHPTQSHRRRHRPAPDHTDLPMRRWPEEASLVSACPPRSPPAPLGPLPWSFVSALGPIAAVLGFPRRPHIKERTGRCVTVKACSSRRAPSIQRSSWRSSRPVMFFSTFLLLFWTVFAWTTRHKRVVPAQRPYAKIDRNYDNLDQVYIRWTLLRSLPLLISDWIEPLSFN